MEGHGSSQSLASNKRRVVGSNAMICRHWYPGLVAACLQYLDFVSLVSCETVNREWCAAARSPSTWQNLYCSVWRRGVALPAKTQLSTLTTGEWKRICHQRRSTPLKVSTRASTWVLPNQIVRVQSFATRRSFAPGAIESVRSEKPLRLLPITGESNTSVGFISPVCYFEARIRGCGSVGFASMSTIHDHHMYGAGSSFHVGWFDGSYGYHGDDGRLYWNERASTTTGRDTAYGPLWGQTRSLHSAVPSDQAADTIGSGLNLRTGQLFFTKNGVFLGYASVRVVTSRVYAAAVSLHHLGDSADINFGRAAFEFDIETFLVNDVAATNAAGA